MVGELCSNGYKLSVHNCTSNRGGIDLAKELEIENEEDSFDEWCKEAKKDLERGRGGINIDINLGGLPSLVVIAVFILLMYGIKAKNSNVAPDCTPVIEEK